MAFTPEDGTGNPDANAYITVDVADGHHGDRGNTAWSDFTVTEKEQSIVRATDYIDKRFGRMFRGLRQTKDQGLEWPRLDAFDNDGFLLSGSLELPKQLIKATAEYSLRTAICNVLSPDVPPPVPKQDMTDSTGARPAQEATGQITRSKDKVDTLEEERWYETNSQVVADNLGAGATGVKSSLVNDFVIPEYPEADLWLEELILSSMNLSLARGD